MFFSDVPIGTIVVLKDHIPFFATISMFAVYTDIARQFPVLPIKKILL